MSNSVFVNAPKTISDERVLEATWLDQAVSQFATLNPNDFASLDLTNIDFISLFEWMSVISLIDQYLTKTDREFSIVLKPPGATRTDFETAYELRRFIDSLNSKQILYQPGGPQVIIPRTKEPNWKYTNTQSLHYSTLLELQRVDEDSCQRFVDPTEIQAWRAAMGEKFEDSTLLENEEFWRTFCREMAANIVEHSAKGDDTGVGFVCARIIAEPLGYHRNLCSRSYAGLLNAKMLNYLRDGFIELCAVDAGAGLPTSLEEAFRSRFPETQFADIDVIQFAFDEFGTSKTEFESWRTKRHALGRILWIVANHGGAIRLRSGEAEVIYSTVGGIFERIGNNLGYRPTSHKKKEYIPGTHVQIILPLKPNPLISSRMVRSRQLPSVYHVDPKHTEGQLLPVEEHLDIELTGDSKKDVPRLAHRCRELNQQILLLNRDEKIVFDFSESRSLDKFGESQKNKAATWSALQFETFVHHIENIIQGRLVLFVEMNPSLARQIKLLEYGEEATKSLLIEHQGSADRGEDVFLGSLIHQPVLGCDTNSNLYVFGLSNERVEEAILSLASEPRTVQSLVDEFGVTRSQLNSIIGSANPLFKVDGDLLSLAWTEEKLANQTQRVLIKHFGNVIDKCRAWRGKPHKRTVYDFSKIGDLGDEIFNLAWQHEDEWLDEFFESSRILTRGRLADEAGQRLIFRLRKFLQKTGRQLSDVKVLAALNAPSLQLANAIRRWWPIANRPSIADLGYYVMLNPHEIPKLSIATDGFVIVQDLFHTGFISNRLVELLRSLEQDKDVICKIALAEMPPDQEKVESNPFDYWRTTRLKNGFDISSHALVRLPRPKAAIPPSQNKNAHPHWVEPRTLRPMSLRQLRKEPAPDQAESFHKKESFFSEFFEECILSNGHYVYGAQHYTIAIDVERALSGKLGGIIESWIANICAGKKVDDKEESIADYWKSPRGTQLKGDVSAVLMPLHSQIHYLWPRVEQLLRNSGRRQPVWHLDATLFLGHGPSYRLPLQLEHQIEKAVYDALLFEFEDNDGVWGKPKQRRGNFDKALSIFILDDATISGRTLETILAAIIRSLKNAYLNHNAPDIRNISPIRWIRYFSVFNQLSHSRFDIWKTTETIGKNPSIPFVFESFGHFFGIPVFQLDNCPKCSELRQTKRAIVRAEFLKIDGIKSWLEKRHKELLPIAIDIPRYQEITHQQEMQRPIKVLRASDSLFSESRFVHKHADSAIWRFYFLMYLSYPPSDLLATLLEEDLFNEGNSKIDGDQHRRYRIAIYDWCLRHWQRMVATSSRKIFITSLLKEVLVGKDLEMTKMILNGVSRVHFDEYIQFFVGILLRRLAKQTPSQADLPSISQIEFSINLFMLRFSEDELAKVFVRLPPNDETDPDSCAINSMEKIQIMDAFERLANEFPETNLNYCRLLHLRFGQPRKTVGPKWALRVVAEHLFRGRDQSRSGSNHKLLPLLLKTTREFETTDANKQEVIRDRNLLNGCLGIFVAAINELNLTTNFFGELVTRISRMNNLIGDCEEVMAWAALSYEEPGFEDIPDELIHFELELGEDQPFTQQFNSWFHIPLEELKAQLKSKQSDNLQFEFQCEPGLENARVLVFVQRFVLFLENVAIDPARQMSNSKNGDASFCSSIVVTRQTGSMLRFRILTGYAVPDRANENTEGGRNFGAADTNLRPFGVIFDDVWKSVDETEREAGYIASYTCFVPAGFEGEDGEF